MYNILIFGDSITWGAVDSKGGWAQRIKDHANIQTLAGKDNNNNVYPLGISGENSGELLKRLKAEASLRLDEDNKTVLIIAIGINDSQIELLAHTNKISAEDFRKNLNQIIEIGKNLAQQIIFIGLTPVDEGKVKPMPWKLTHGYTNEQIEKYNNVLKQVAEEQSVTFLEIYTKFQNGDTKALLFDGLHPNDKGHKLIYSIVEEHLLKEKIISSASSKDEFRILSSAFLKHLVA
jgi:lysophospholipase L1-like esterase